MPQANPLSRRERERGYNAAFNAHPLRTIFVSDGVDFGGARVITEAGELSSNLPCQRPIWAGTG